MTGPERELVSLVAAAPLDRVRFREACGAVADWDALVACAERNGLAGTIRAETRDAGMALPPDAARRLDASLVAERLHQERHRAALAEAAGALEVRRIRAVSLKGVVLGERLYGDPALRRTSDIDVLVAEDDCERAVAALSDAGWSWKEDPTERYYRRHHQNLHLFRRDHPVIELHFRAFVGFGIAVPSEDLVERAVAHRTGWIRTWVLCPEDEVLYLGLHAAGHLLERLGWLYDVKLLALRHPELSWPEVAGRARSLGASRALAFALGAVRALGAPVPVEALGKRGVLESAAERVRRIALGRGEHSARRTAGALAFHALLSRNAPDAARFLAHGLGRIVRRRARRHLGRFVPEEWSG